MTAIVLTDSMWGDLIDAVRYEGIERCAILLTNDVQRLNGGHRLLAHTMVVPDPNEYSKWGDLEAELTPGFVARVTKSARLSGSGIVFVHSHPGDAEPTFSSIDDQGEMNLANFLAHRLPDVTHAAIVVSKGGVAARELGATVRCDVVVVGSDRRVLTAIDRAEPLGARFDRQIRAFGRDGQIALEALTVGIVGLGGTGSIVAQELVHLGVRRFILLDPDVVEESNLNRVAGAIPGDVGRDKVEIAKRYISSVAPSAQVSTKVGDLTYARDGRCLLDADIVFGCTDSHGSRAVLEQIAYQYLIPIIDMGAVIAARDGCVNHIVGRIQMLAPGLACLTCSEVLDPNQVRRDMMTAFERQSDPYIPGFLEPAPAVISLNATIVSLAVTMMLAAVTGLPIPARSIIYRALSSSVRAVLTKPVSYCVVCSSAGRLARGDSLPFPGRQD